MPPVTPDPVHFNGHLYYLFRREFVSRYPKRLCSDAYSVCVFLFLFFLFIFLSFFLFFLFFLFFGRRIFFISLFIYFSCYYDNFLLFKNIKDSFFFF